MLQTPDTVQISEILKRLKRKDPTLTEVSMNNYKDVDSVLIEIAGLLKTNTHVTKISVANTQMKPAVCLVRLHDNCVITFLVNPVVGNRSGYRKPMILAGQSIYMWEAGNNRSSYSIGE